MPARVLGLRGQAPAHQCPEKTGSMQPASLCDLMVNTTVEIIRSQLAWRIFTAMNEDKPGSSKDEAAFLTRAIALEMRFPGRTKWAGKET